MNKKTQFASPIIIILLIVIFFTLHFELSKIEAARAKSETTLQKIANDIKSIEELDINWQASLTKEALLLLQSINSSGTINELLAEKNAQINTQGELPIINYQKTYTIKDYSKTINGTIIVPYPYKEFTEIEKKIRECIKTEIWEQCAAKYGATIEGEIILLSIEQYPLSESYNYIITLQ